MINHEIGFATLITKQMFFVFSEHYDLSFTPGWQILVQSYKYKHYIDMLLWLKSTIKTPERCDAVFIFNFEHMQQINLIFYS